MILMEVDFTHEISLEADYQHAVAAVVEAAIKLGFSNEAIFSDIRASRARQFCLNCGRPSESMYCPDCQSEDAMGAREAARKRVWSAILKAQRSHPAG